MDISAGVSHRLTDSKGFNAGAKWSPNGQKIDYISFNGQTIDTYIMDATGQNKHHVPLEFTLLGESHWSPDSQWLLYYINKKDVEQSAVLNVDTGEINFLPQAVRLPVWTPDSQTIVYHTLNKDGTSHLFGMNISCFEQKLPCEFKELAIFQNRNMYHNPLWSPDGHFMAFGSYKDGNAKIMLATLRCTDLVEICVDRYDIIGESSYLIDPIWSADSQQLAFTASQSEVDVIHIPSGQRQSFTLNNGIPFPRNWSPNGQFIYYLASQGSLAPYLLNIMNSESYPADPNLLSEADMAWRPRVR